jgi:O-antigen/teichoic acid export membrane protein
MSGSSVRRGVVASSAGYFISQTLIMLGGFVSMPILTRLLTKEEYGVLNLVFASIAILLLVGQLGFPQATVRFYAEERRAHQTRFRNFCSNMLGGAFASSALVAVLAVIAVGWTTGQVEYLRCMQLAGLVVITRAVSSVVLQLYRSEERVFAYASAQIIGRYATLGLAVTFLLLYQGKAREVILATVIGEGVVLAVCVMELMSRGAIGWPRIAWPTIAAATKYGLPLAIGGSASFVLDYSDRFLIQRFLGFDAVASYAVPYDLTQNLAATIFAPIRLAAIPIIFRLWASDGQEETSRFVSQVLTYMVALSIPIAALFLVMNHEIVLLLASAKYGSSAALTPYLLPGIFIGEMNFLIGVGLTIQKNTTLLALITLSGGLLNVFLNVLLIPVLGLIGAAAATTVSYVAVMGATYWKAQPVLRLRLGYAVVGKAIVATAVMVVLVLGFGPFSAGRAVDVALRGILGAGAAGMCMVILDRNIRERAWLRVG